MRREWWRWPQEAHLVESLDRRYRRLTVDEIARLQGFDPAWFAVPGISDLDKIRAIGDAVPPPLADAIIGALDENVRFNSRVAIEICAGSGGLASASARRDFHHALLVDHWSVSGEILRFQKPWEAGKVTIGDVMDIDASGFRGSVELVSGGPPCQPWSTAGRRLGLDDERDLLGRVHAIVKSITPRAFVFENVAGLLSEGNREYFDHIVRSLRDSDGPHSYGVAAGLFNAADFGLPQRRRRVFIVGLRGMPSSRAYEVFDAVEARATHHDPARPALGHRVPWLPVSTVLGADIAEQNWYDWPFGRAVDD